VNPIAIRRALYGKLSGDTTLNNLLGPPPSGWSKSIYYGFAPDTADEDNYPFVLLSHQSPNIPTYANVAKPAFETQVWWIRAVDQNSTADPAEAVSDRLDELLTDGSLSIAGGDTVMWLRRQSSQTYPEVADGVRYFHSGGLYRLVTEPA
jgi:hypothetical protein